MRLIDADALEKEGWSLHRTVEVDRHTMEYQVKQIAKVPTIEPERKKGKWVYVTDGCIDYFRCDGCGKPVFADTPYCPNCGAEMG